MKGGVVLHCADFSATISVFVKGEVRILYGQDFSIDPNKFQVDKILYRRITHRVNRRRAVGVYDQRRGLEQRGYGGFTRRGNVPYGQFTQSRRGEAKRELVRQIQLPCNLFMQEILVLARPNMPIVPLARPRK